MASSFQRADRVFETTLSAGQIDPFDLEGAVAGYQAYGAKFIDGQLVPYVCADGTDFEIGIGTFRVGTGGGGKNQIERPTTVLDSSNGGAKVNWPSSGTRDIFLDIPAAERVLAKEVQDGGFVYGAAGGTADVITLTLTPAVTAYVAGQVFQFKASAANTAAPTLNVNGVGAVALQKRGQALGAGEIQAGDIVTAVYDGTVFQVTSVGRDSFPTGTRMIFAQAAAPVGWTKETTFNQHALRVTSGAGGVAGGSVDFTTAFSTSRSVGGSSGSASPGVAAHVHQQRYNTAGAAGRIKIETTNEPSSSPTTTNAPTTSSAGGGSSHTHGSAYTVNVGVRYLDVITAVKN